MGETCTLEFSWYLWMPGRSRGEPREALPVYLTAFVGRDRQRQELSALLANGRLLTLTGTGGSGKTRLAVQVGSDIVGRYSGGVWFVDLMKLEEPSALVPAVASSVGSRERPGRSALDSLTATLRKSSRLLVIDGCEHLVDSCAELTNALLGACPELSILATSQEPLGIPGEAIYRVPALSLPAPGSSEEELLESEAVQLFIQRAKLVRPDLQLTARHLGSIGQVCQRLDGLPLAIELAAARTRLMPVSEILRRLEDRFVLLKGASRVAIARHQTLAATVRWSHDHLSEPEKVLFRRLSVFAGSFTQEAAQAVCGGAPLDRGAVPDIVERLADKSLLVPEEGGDGSARYRLLETLRQYGQERLVEVGEVEVRAVHAQYFLAVVEVADRMLREGGEVEAVARIDGTHDELRTALAWSLGAEPALAVQMAVAMGKFWLYQGHFSEGRRFLDSVLPHTQAGTASRLLVLLRLAAIFVHQANVRIAALHAEEALQLAEDLADDRLLVEVLQIRGIAAAESGDLARARASYERILAMAPAAKTQIAGALNNLAVTEYSEGNHERAAALIRRAIEGFAAIPAHLGLCQALDTAVRIDFARGDIDRAWKCALEALGMSFSLGHLMVVASVLDGVAMLLIAESAAHQGLRVAGAAAALRERIGSESSPVWRRDRERWLIQGRQSIGETLAEQLLRQGGEMALESVLDLILNHKRTPRHAAHGLPGGLTARQRQIAILVAEGLSNKEIGKRLDISERTVETHLVQMRTRVKARSRAQLAALVTRDLTTRE
jgi:predicted ATPase/DNA-binding CsgD family transcriptional regulator